MIWNWAVGLRATELELSDRLVADDAGITLTARTGSLGVEVTDAGFAGGLLSALVNIRNTLGSVVMDGQLTLQEAALEELVWRPQGRASALGALNFSADFEGSGDNMKELVSSLTGGGTLLVENGEFRNINPLAFRRTMRAVDAGLELEEEKISAEFLNHIDDGVLPFNSAEGVFSIVSGAVRASSVSVDAGAASALGGGTIDLINLLIESDWTLRMDPGTEAVVGAEPQIGISFGGTLENPEREIDVAALTGFLTVREFEREVERIENQEEDILEKEFFGRQLRLQRERRLKRQAESPPPPAPQINLQDQVRDALQDPAAPVQ